jgi:quercetin dioxygenase-like cupin family protein
MMHVRLRTTALRFGLALSVASFAAMGADAVIAAPSPSAGYAYATNGIKDDIGGPFGAKWKLLLDQSNLGGKELEMLELTMKPGTVVPSHMHGSLEIIYVLAGVYEHEVNGKLYRLSPGMVGLVRPGDHVRHLVPNAGPTKVLIIWVPGGEAKDTYQRAKGTPIDPVPEADSPTREP